MSFSVDIEVTNRCNADCYFCPRDQTPHEGLMAEETFQQALARAVEFREQAAGAGLDDPEVRVSLCGLGEPLVNPRTAQWARQVKDAGFHCVLSSNGALLDERRAEAVLEAGVDEVMINLGDIGERYEDVYKLPWQRTHDNVVRFAEMARGRCDPWIVLVNHRQDPDYTSMLKDFWRERGLSRFMEYDIMNRGGSLFVDHMQFETLPQQQEARRLLDEQEGRALCASPFAYVFVGYDGQYYLCCSDWRKEVAFGSVFDRAILDVTRGKLEHVACRGEVCRTCNLDPLNQLTDEMRAADQGGAAFDAQGAAVQMVEFGRRIEGVLEKLVPGVTEALPEEQRRRRRLPLLDD
jgi:MoaA/NifB/PqqE/SkfB family radical SAM enzyme